ncbi:hypothetical protein EQG49_03115 [Periweissella cryptocerci]|uniref:Uncharacterized protein n=1 Tax=Periweissella cryptocerci TaxID=2506420 RepID=A0A4P6YS99_9LACO|nr:hypothetical protein [Periweissella cryptocerci]QBO35516.1 hypothetical protein EQG49_03115 [Periweissella cryptocerci]
MAQKKDEPTMLAGTQSRAEREAGRVAQASQKRRHLITKMIMTIIVLAIIGGGIAWYFANRQANHVADENAKNSKVVKSASSTPKSSNKIATQYAVDWAPSVKTISPEEYINNIYGKTPKLYLIVGSSADARIDQLAKLTKSNSANFGLNIPIYFLDANRYYTNGNNTDRAAFAEILGSVQLAKVDANKLPNTVDFESSLFANKLTKVDGKAAYAKYTAPAKAFNDGKTLDAFLKGVNQAMSKK